MRSDLSEETTEMFPAEQTAAGENNSQNLHLPQ